MLFKKHAKKVTAAALAVLMTTGVVQTGALSAFAAGEQEAAFPASFDLRDRGVVTPVRVQDPWASCWSFASTAAAETSILSMLKDKGMGIDAKAFDLSEKHLAWFATNPITEAIDPNQAGEGMFITGKKDTSYTSALYNNGGYGLNTSTLFASGVGPVREDAATLAKIEGPEVRAQMELYLRYRGDTGLTKKEYFIANPEEGKAVARGILIEYAGMEPEAVVANKEKSGTVKFLRNGGYLSDEDFENLDVDKLIDATFRYYLAEKAEDYCYTNKDDWTIPETVTVDGQTILTRNISSGYTMVDGNKLPSLFNRDADGKWESVNWDGINAVKSELMKGRGVSAGFQADASMPGDPPLDRYMRPDTCAHYTYKDEGTGHMICIVGWDDDYSASNFKTDHQPPANGAWLAKNSWGCETEYELSPTGKHIGENKWGVENEEGKTTGYFWISYYDKSLNYCESMSFDTDLADADGDIAVKMYDYMPSLVGVRTGQTTDEQSRELLKTANVFVNDTGADVSLSSVSTKTANPNATVKYSVYLLNDNAASPEDGTLLGTKTASYEFAGFHREKLDGSITVKKGERFAVVAEETVVKNGETLYEYAVNVSYSKAHAEAVQAEEAEKGISSDDRDRNADEYGVAVVNKGESFIFDSGEWTDWTEYEPRVQKLDDYAIDNFSIKAYMVSKTAEPKMYGDVDADGVITIADATAIQKFGIELPTGIENFNREVADVNADGRVSILDVTCVQKYLAEYETGYGRTGQPYNRVY